MPDEFEPKVGDIVMFQNVISAASPGAYPDALVEVVAAPVWAGAHEHEVAWFKDKLNGGIWVQRPGSSIGPYRARATEISPAPVYPEHGDEHDFADGLCQYPNCDATISH